MGRICLVLLLLLVAGGRTRAIAQSELLVQASNVLQPDLLFDRFNSNHGLPDNRIRSVYQDQQGFLWLGTMNGIARYDGYAFKKYFKTANRNSISGNWAHDITGDSQNNLWIGTSEGLNCFDTTTETFRSYQQVPGENNSLLHKDVRTLAFDPYGRLWVGTPKGLSRLDPATGTFTHFSGFPLNTAIGKIIRSQGDFIWVATQEGLVHLNVKTEQHTFYPIQVRPNAYGDRFWSLLEDNRDLYIATGGNGLVKLPFQAASQTYGPFTFLTTFVGSPETLADTEVFDLCKSPSGDLWLGTGRGLARIGGIRDASPRLTFFRTNPLNGQSISNNRVYRVFIDHTGVLWCGTEMGLNKLDLQLLPFRYYTFTDPKAKDHIRSISSLDGQNVWLGTSDSGFLRYNKEQGTTTSYRFRSGPSFQNRHRSLTEDQAGHLWLGTLGGAIKLDKKQPARFQELAKGQTVFALFQDSRQNTWIGTNNGLTKVTQAGEKVDYAARLKSPTGTPNWYVRTIYEDHRGHIWHSFEERRINRYDPDQDTFTEEFSHDPNQQIIGNTILSLLEYPKNVFWIGSEEGLNKITLGPEVQGKRAYTLRTYTEEDGLPDKSVKGILADAKGHLWLSTIKGLARLDVQREQFQNFLPNLNLNYSCYQKVHDRLFLFGTTDGFVAFNPEEVSTNTHAPQVVFSDFRLFNADVEIGKAFHDDVILEKAISHTRSLTLNYRNNVFTVGFRALHFANPDNNAYAYRMVGFDQDWIYPPAANRSATYTNLDPGTYHFKVKAANSSGLWQQEPTVLTVTVLPPPWKTWWAIGVYFLLFNGLLFGFVRYLLSQSRQRQQIQLEQREKEQLQHLNQMKLRFFTDISHEFRTPLSLIVGPVEDLLQAPEAQQGGLKQKLSLIHRNCRKLLYLIDELMTFQKMDQGRLPLKPERLDLVGFSREIFANFEELAFKKDIRFRFVPGQPQLFSRLDPDKMEMILNNLLSNAFKCTPPGGTITLQVQQASPEQLASSSLDPDQEWLSLSVEDTGKGMTKPELQHLFERFFQSDSSRSGTGLGLALTKSLVELHQGQILVQSEPGVKTSFTVFLPLSPEQPQEAGTGAVNRPALVADYDVATLMDNASMDNSPWADEEVPALGATAHRLLIVDDNPEVLAFLEMLFCGSYQVLRATNGREALDLVQHQEPDLIISDVMMPEMDGITLCTRLKTELLTCHIPVVLLTARSTVENTLEGLQTGADDYIPKPFHPDLLRVRVAKLIEARQRLLQIYGSRPVGLGLPEQEVPAPEPILRMNPLDESFLGKVKDAIFRHLSNDEFSVEGLGSEVGMSRSHLFRKLKAITGKTPIEFIYFVRLQYGLDLLAEGKLNVSEVAYEIGFKNPSSFSKSFRRQFGKTPTEYVQEVVVPPRPALTP
jgi:signal transduction histidine kinase/ligand-binding sensor domain-containing protein/CheY-like chemotaxis protein/AraC-like DNA-binding protein